MRDTIKENRAFKRMYAKAKSVVTPSMVVYCRRGRFGKNRLGVTVSTKLGGAVVRNRARRRLREVIPTQRTAFLHRPKALWKSGPVWYWGPFSAIFYCIINERVCGVKFHFSGSGIRIAVSIIPLPKHDHSLHRFLSGLFDGRDIQADP